MSKLNKFFDLIDEEIESGNYFEVDANEYESRIRNSYHYHLKIENEGEEKAKEFLSQKISQLEIVPLLVENAFKEAIRQAKLIDIEAINDKIFEAGNKKQEILKREYDRYNTRYDEYSKNSEFSVGISINHTIDYVISYLIWDNPFIEIDTEKEINETICPSIRAFSVYMWLSEQRDDFDTKVIIADQKQIPDKKTQIKEILEQAGSAFDDPKHIQKIIDAFISYKETGKLPEYSDKKPVQIDSNFIEPFRQLYKKDIFKRAEIGKLLTYFIQPRSSTKSEFSEMYILKLLSGRQRN